MKTDYFHPEHFPISLNLLFLIGTFNWNISFEAQIVTSNKSFEGLYNKKICLANINVFGIIQLHVLKYISSRFSITKVIYT